MRWLALLLAFALFPAQEPPSGNASISGVVLRANTDQPIERVEVKLEVVSLAASNADRATREDEPVWTDDDGRFEFRNLPAGRYRVYWERSGYFHPPSEAGGSADGPAFITTKNSTNTPYLNVSYPCCSVGARALDVDVREKLTSTVTLPLIPGGVITGNVMDTHGRPMAGSWIVAFRVERYELGDPILLDTGNHATVDDRGNYRLYGLQPGDYYIKADSKYLPASPDAATSSYFPVGRLASATPVTVRAGTETRNVTFIGGSEPVAKISGTVTIAVTNFKPQEDPDSADKSSRERDTRLDLLFCVVPRGRGPKDPFPMIMRSTLYREADVLAGKFELPGIRPGEYDVYALLRNENDTLNLDFFAGRTTVTVSSAGAQNVSILVGPGNRVQGRVVLTDGVKTDFKKLQVRLEPWAAVYPSIYAAEGMGSDAASASASLTYVYPSIYPLEGMGWQKVGPDGSFEFSGMVNHRYRVKVSDLPPNATVIDIRQGGKSVFAEGVVVGDDAESFEIIVSDATGTVEVNVTDDEHRTVKGATVTLVPADQRGNPELYAGTAFDDAESRYTPLTGIIPGEYLVFAWDNIVEGAEMNEEFLSKYVDHAVRVVVEPRQTIRIDAPLILSAR